MKEFLYRLFIILFMLIGICFAIIEILLNIDITITILILGICWIWFMIKAERVY